jgi:4-hydroxy-3-methylbut-2-en-1-yl diphosphate reductase
MARQFDIPSIYHSPIIRTIKESRQILDPRKKDLKPSVLDFGPVRFLIPRHFGFCFGVQNAIDIAYRTIEENSDKPVYLLSEMIHNPTVNEDLLKKGVKFLFHTDGTEIIPINSLSEDDIVIVPAFGTTIAIQEKLESVGINPYQYDTTCPFVEKVWKKGDQLGSKGHALVIHGKYQHEETRATFSHAAKNGPTVVVYNPDEAVILGELMTGERPKEEFESYFGHKSTPDFDPTRDLNKFGVINQTTMLASETKEVMEILRQAALKLHGQENIQNHLADTSDTLCYATNENQSATLGLLQEQADLAIVVGGYNSSNTMHIVELLEAKFPTYHIRDAAEMISKAEIRHFDQWKKSVETTLNWFIPVNSPVTVAITSGASCPDSLVDEVIMKIVGYFDNSRSIEQAMQDYQTPSAN